MFLKNASQKLNSVIKKCKKRTRTFLATLFLPRDHLVGQIRWAGGLILVLISIQLFRGIHSPAGEETGEVPGILTCGGYVQIGTHEGPVVCLDAPIDDFLAAGLPPVCIREFKKKVLQSGDRVLWRFQSSVDSQILVDSQVSVDSHGSIVSSESCRIILYRMSPRLLASLDIVLDINSASERELMSISGLGSEMARRIVEFRGRHGRFRDVEGLLEVKGIGRNLLRRYRGRLYCGEGSSRRD